MDVIYELNPEDSMIHRGVFDISAKWDPRCNMPTARKAGDAGTNRLSKPEVVAMVNAGRGHLCGHCCPETP